MKFYDQLEASDKIGIQNKVSQIKTFHKMLNGVLQPKLNELKRRKEKLGAGRRKGCGDEESVMV